MELVARLQLGDETGPTQSTPDAVEDPKVLYETLAAGEDARPGIVTTARGMGDTLVSWTRYHLTAGFQRVYLYMDDPAEATALQAAAPDVVGDARVVLIRCDANHRRVWAGLRMWPKFERFAEEEVQARQELNAEHAVSLALRDGITWLLHCDADELFHCPDRSVVEHFNRLTADRVTVMNYINLEAVPESSDVDNFLEEVTLFKTHLSRLPDFSPAALRIPDSELPPCSHDPAVARREAVHRGVKYWVKRSPTRQQYFRGYENGKSAVAVVDGAVPLSVHEWLPPTQGLFDRGCHNIPMLDTRGALAYREESACILHYISCGFSWWQHKYKLLGTFDDAWFGGALPIPKCFHTQSRDLVGSGDDASARLFYENTVVMSDEVEKERQLAAGVLLRVTGPRTIMLGAKASSCFDSCV